MNISPSYPRAERATRIPYLGVVYDPLSEEQVLDMLISRDPQADFAAVVTPNADHLVRIDKSSGDVVSAYRDAWLCLNDSRIVGFLAKAGSVPLTTVPGADLVRSLFNDERFDPAWPVLFVGGTDEMFEAVVRKFGLGNAVYFNAPMGLLKDAEKFETTMRFIEAHPARYVLLMVGSPQQELLALSLARRGNARGIGLCTGAAVEFLVHPERRAPRWMSRVGLEWLFRLVREPRRLWRRYLVDSPKLFGLAFRDWRGRGARRT